MDLVAFDRLLGTEDTILDLLARGIGSAVWKIEVRGALDNPKVDAVFQIPSRGGKSASSTYISTGPVSSVPFPH